MIFVVPTNYYHACVWITDQLNFASGIHDIMMALFKFIVLFSTAATGINKGRHASSMLKVAHSLLGRNPKQIKCYFFVKC